MVIRFNGPGAFKKPEKYLVKQITIDFTVEYWGQIKKLPAGWHLRLSNAAITGHAIDYVAPQRPRNEVVDLTIWLNHKELVGLIEASALGKTPGIGNLTTAGNLEAWADTTALVEKQTPAFNIVTP